jgi:hypothetical protein
VEEQAALSAWEDAAEMVEQEQADRDLIDQIADCDPYEDDSYYDGDYSYPVVVVAWEVEV